MFALSLNLVCSSNEIKVLPAGDKVLVSDGGFVVDKFFFGGDVNELTLCLIGNYMTGGCVPFLGAIQSGVNIDLTLREFADFYGGPEFSNVSYVMEVKEIF
jgi:hypothetical protein